jgi:hypothetical protein
LLARSRTRPRNDRRLAPEYWRAEEQSGSVGIRVPHSCEFGCRAHTPSRRATTQGAVGLAGASSMSSEYRCLRISAGGIACGAGAPMATAGWGGEISPVVIGRFYRHADVLGRDGAHDEDGSITPRFQEALHVVLDRSRRHEDAPPGGAHIARCVRRRRRVGRPRRGAAERLQSVRRPLLRRRAAASIARTRDR